MSFERYFPRNFSSFCDLKFFPGFSLFFPFESYSFQEFLKFSGLKSCFSRTTGNGLETDELGLAGSLACHGLRAVCAVCAPHSLARCYLKTIFPEFFQVFVI